MNSNNALLQVVAHKTAIAADLRLTIVRASTKTFGVIAYKWKSFEIMFRNLIFTLVIVLSGNSFGDEILTVYENILTQLENQIYDMDLCVDHLISTGSEPTFEGVCASMDTELLQIQDKRNTNEIDRAFGLIEIAKKKGDIGLVRHYKIQDVQKYMLYLMEAKSNRIELLLAIDQEYKVRHALKLEQ